MKHTIILPFLLALTAHAFAQKETFDIISYKFPKGWKKEIKNTVVSLSNTDKKNGGWCLIGIYKSVATKGGIEQDFESEWKELVTKNYHITDTPQVSEIQEAGGWKIKAGSGKFTFNKKPAAAILTTFSGYGRCVSIVATTGNERYIQNIQDLIASVELGRPDENANAADKPADPSPPGDFAFTTTNFDDGWTSTVYDDYVQVTKNNIKLFLSYIEKFNESEYSGTGKEKRHFYWNAYVSKYFITGEMRYNRGGALSDFSDDYIEAWATDRQTNEKRYILMILRIVPNTGTLSIIIASAPDDQQLRRQFPKADLKFDNDLLPMYGYNKFAVGKNDLVGKWSSSGGGTMNWYSTITGQNVGATGAVTADVFQFNNDQTYSSEHKGATGWVGAMNTYQQKYKGNYAVSNWELTINNRFEGKTESYDAWFEALKGGRVLHLQNKEYSGSQYHLFKEK